MNQGESGIDEAPAKRGRRVWPLPGVPGVPGVRDTYVLLAGVVFGVLLGPAVLGRAAPNVYEVLFVGGRAEAQALAVYEAETKSLLEQLGVTGVSAEAAEQLVDDRGVDGRPIVEAVEAARTGHAFRLLRMMMAIVAAVVVVMLLETFAAPRPEDGGAPGRGVVLGRLITVRYALAAMLIALALARPAPLANLPVVLTAVLLGVAGLAGFIPLARAGKQERRNAGNAQ
jgi:hypothetical protein